MRTPSLRRRERQSCLAEIVLLLASLAAAGLTLSPSARAAEHAHESLPNLDRRTEVAPAAAPRLNAASIARADAEPALRNRLPDAEVERHPILSGPKWLAAREGFLTGVNTKLVRPVFWQLVTNAVIQTYGQFRVPVDALESQEFFRLRAPW